VITETNRVLLGRLPEQIPDAKFLGSGPYVFVSKTKHAVVIGDGGRGGDGMRLGSVRTSNHRFTTARKGATPASRP